MHDLHERVPRGRRARARPGGGAFPALTGKVEINDIGTVIGSHTGPGTVVLFFMGDEREE